MSDDLLPKSSRKAMKMERPPSIKAYSVTEEDAPGPHDPVTGCWAPSESSTMCAFVEVRGRQTDPTGRRAFAKQNIKKNTLFSCTRVRMYLRHDEDGAPNPWAICVSHHKTCKAVCTSLGWEVPTRANGKALWVGPCRAGKKQGNGVLYSEMTPPDDRTAERLFRINSSKGGGRTNVRLCINAFRPKEDGGIVVAQACVMAVEGIKKGQELLAKYDFLTDEEIKE